MILVSSSMSYVHASVASSSSVSGQYIKDSAGNTVTLKGFVYTYFIDSPSGSWQLASGKTEWSTFDTTAIQSNLDAIKAGAPNVVVVYTTASYWIDNTQNFRNNIEYFIAQAQQRGIYVELSFTRDNANQPGQISYPYPPYGYTLNWQSIYGNGYINNQQDFVNLWVNIASALKAYPNVIFKFWGEPSGDGTPAAEKDWATVNQLCINGIRAIGSTNLIVIQWGLGLADPFSGWVASMSWINDYPLTDPAGNLIYSEHLYSHPNFYNYKTGLYYSSTSDMQRALTDTLVIQTASVYPVFMDEMGCDQYLSDMSTEYAWFSNTLGLLNQYGIGYAVFAAPPWNSNTEWGLVLAGQPNYTPNQAGQILQQQLGYQGSTGSSSSSSQSSTTSQSSQVSNAFGNTNIGAYSGSGNTALSKRFFTSSMITMQR